MLTKRVAEGERLQHFVYGISFLGTVFLLAFTVSNSLSSAKKTSVPEEIGNGVREPKELGVEGEKRVWGPHVS